MRLTLGPLQYFWPRERVLAFYREAADWPLDVIYLGETVAANAASSRRATGSRSPTSSQIAGARGGAFVAGAARAGVGAQLAAPPRRKRSLQSRGQRPRCGAAAARARPALRRWPVAQRLQPRDAAAAVRGRTRTTGARRRAWSRTSWRSAPAACRCPSSKSRCGAACPLSYSARCFTARALDLAGRLRVPLHRLPGRTAARLARRRTVPHHQRRVGADVGPLRPRARARRVACRRHRARAHLSAGGEGTADIVARFRTALASGVSPPRVGGENSLPARRRGHGASYRPNPPCRDRRRAQPVRNGRLDSTRCAARAVRLPGQLVEQVAQCEAEFHVAGVGVAPADGRTACPYPPGGSTAAAGRSPCRARSPRRPPRARAPRRDGRRSTRPSAARDPSPPRRCGGRRIRRAGPPRAVRPAPVRLPAPNHGAATAPAGGATVRRGARAAATSAARDAPAACSADRKQRRADPDARATAGHQASASPSGVDREVNASTRGRTCSARIRLASSTSKSLCLRLRTPYSASVR